MSSPDSGAGTDDDRQPPAEAITDPALAPEVDNPADANPPTGAEAGPGDSPAAADQEPIAAPGAPGALTSDATPSQGEERGEATPASEVGEVPGGDAGAPESGAAGQAPAAAPEAEPAAPDGEVAGGDESSALAPDQVSPPGAGDPAAAAVQRAAEDKAAQAVAAREAAAAAGPGPDVEPDAEPAARDEAREEMVAGLRSVLGTALVETHVVAGVDAWVRVSVGAWRLAAEVCRDQLGLAYFDYLSAVDWLPSPYGRSEDPPPADDPEGGEAATGDTGADPEKAVLEHGYAGGETRMQLLARLVSPTTHLGLTLKADLDDDAPVAPSWIEVYPGADWHEREAWEMYGIDFSGHPNLVHLYLPGDFEGHPLRKDFPLLAREVKPWPGLVDVEAMPGEGEG